MDYYLSFPDEASAKAVLYRIEGAQEATETTEAVEGTERPNFVNIDTIGVIYKDEQPITGWHVNVRLMDNEDGSALESFAVTPSTPLRIWG
jgi:hypothetical protein